MTASGVLPRVHEPLVRSLLPPSASARPHAVEPRLIVHPAALRAAKHAAQRSQVGHGKPVVTLARPSYPRTDGGDLRLASALQLYTGSVFDWLDQANSGGAYPPDPQVAVGPSHIVEMVNDAGSVRTKAGRVLVSFTLSSFFGTGSDAISDPQVLYDAISGRWFASEVDVTHNGTLIAVSANGDPTASWSIYEFVRTQAECPDQPKLGVSNDLVVVTRELFGGGCTQGGPQTVLGGTALVLNKSELTSNASSVHYQSYGPDSRYSNLDPARSLTSTTTQYMAAADIPTSTVIHVFNYSGAPPNGAFGQTSDVPVTELDAPPNAEQRGSSKVLDTADNRIEDAVWRQGVLSLASNDACVPAGDTVARACARLMSIATNGPSLTFEDDLAFSYAYSYEPSVEPDGQGHLMSVFGYSSTSDYPSVLAIGYSGGNYTDAYYIQAGKAAIDSGDGEAVQRFGDYFGIGVDPANQSIVWGNGEFGKSSGWGTAVGAFSLNPKAFAPPPPPAIPRAKYSGKTSQHKGITLRVSADGRHVVGITYGVKLTCPKPRHHRHHDSFGSSFLSPSDTAKIGGQGAFTATEGFASDSFIRKGTVKFAGSFARRTVHGTLRASEKSRHFGTCRTPNVTWTASA